MKPLSLALIMIAFFGCFNITNAQKSPAPNLFDRYETTLNLPKAEIEKIFTITTGNALQLSLSNDAVFTGTITSSIQHYPNLKSAVIKLSNFDGALFSISERKNDDNSITYVGRIINEKYADAYILKQNANGQYFLNKIKLNDLIQDR